MKDKSSTSLILNTHERPQNDDSFDYFLDVN